MNEKENRLAAIEKIIKQLQSDTNTKQLGDFLEDYTAKYTSTISASLDADIHDLLKGLPYDLTDEAGGAILNIVKTLTLFKRALNVAGV